MCGVMKACGCHPGSPGTLLLPTNSLPYACHGLAVHPYSPSRASSVPCSPLDPCTPRTSAPNPVSRGVPSRSPSLPQALTPCPPFQNGLTPLHVAAHYDNQKVALLLLEKGASPHATAKVSPPAMRAAWGQPAPPRPQVHSPLGGVSKGVRNVYSGQAYGE